MALPLKVGALRPTGSTKPAEDKKTVVDLNALEAETVAGEIRWVSPWPVRTMITSKGIVVFSVQLKSGKRFGVTPVMPRNPYDPSEVMAPDNGTTGYLQLEISENAKLELTADGRYDFTIRPKFLALAATREELEDPPKDTKDSKDSKGGSK